MNYYIYTQFLNDMLRSSGFLFLCFLQADLAHIQKKKDEEKALKELKSKAAQKGSFGGTGLKKSGKKQTAICALSTFRIHATKHILMGTGQESVYSITKDV